ncbi:hypothetical protein PB01_03065 [Psychrobacillus glaciei]|uniref:Uncharacterized protein n=1 Tax=Psychrobacillus glaciei TaxID=2283160 RepID=A0A5J6SJ09_9BACI|nr:hypothetical protein [Psychrobacillus glaciei]QFF97875.1 hypothetical protein PB01_03065 [Psychrobacillus glaciei]
MADLHYREKLRTIEKAATMSNEIPDKAKSLGMGCFTLGTILFIAFLLFIAFSLFANGIVIGAVITIFIAIILLVVLIKLWTAPKFP